MKDFISYFMEMTKEGESPDAFWRWSAISVLSAALRNNVYFRTGIGSIYPNLYVILHSDSGVARKASGPKAVISFLRTAGITKIISGRASLQAVMKELANNYTSEKGMMISGASGILYSEELSAFLVADPATIPLLIDLYDFHAQYNPTLVSGTTNLKDVCLSMLAASNSDLFTSVFTAQAVKGGLLGRTLIISEKKARHRRSLMDLKPSPHPVEPLVQHLQRLATLKGAVTFDANAEAELRSWYYGLSDAIMDDKIGFASRMETHVVKVAIAVAASKADFNKQVTKDDVEESIELIHQLRATANVLANSSGNTSSMMQVAVLVKAIADSDGVIRRDKLIQRTYGEFTVAEMDELIQVLVQAGFVIEGVVDNAVGYRMTEAGVNRLIKGETDGKKVSPKKRAAADNRAQAERIYNARGNGETGDTPSAQTGEHNRESVSDSDTVSTPAGGEGCSGSNGGAENQQAKNEASPVAKRVYSASEIWGLDEN